MVSELAPPRGNASFCFNISLDRPNGGLTTASCTHPRRCVKMLVALVSVANIPPFFCRLEHVCLFTTLSGCAMKYTHLLASLVLTSCLIGSLARPGT